MPIDDDDKPIEDNYWLFLNKGFYYTVDDELFISTDGVKRIKVGAEGQIFVSGLTDNVDPYVISIDSNNQ